MVCNEEEDSKSPFMGD